MQCNLVHCNILMQTLLAHMLDGPPVESCLVNGVEVSGEVLPAV